MVMDGANPLRLNNRLSCRCPDRLVSRSGDAETPNKHMQLHQQRVIDEKAELDDNATKLSAFIGENPLFEKLDAAERERMKVQNDLMWQYSEVLGQRIAAF